jgi:hypothetical protein
VRGTFPLTSILSLGGERKIKVQSLHWGDEGGFGWSLNDETATIRNEKIHA